MLKVILGLVIVVVGTYMVAKTETMLNAFGRIAFFERYFGIEGGSRLGYKIIGLASIFIGILVMTNLIGGFMTWLLSPLLKYSQPKI